MDNIITMEMPRDELKELIKMGVYEGIEKHRMACDYVRQAVCQKQMIELQRNIEKDIEEKKEKTGLKHWQITLLILSPIISTMIMKLLVHFFK